MFISRTHRSGAGLAGTLLLSLCSLSAVAQTVAFSGGGAVTGPAQTPPQLLGLTLSAATSAYTFAGVSGWYVDKVFDFNTATLVGGGTFTFSNGSSSLSGSFLSSRANSMAPTDLFYTVASGSGLFAGLVGSGLATGATVGNPFSLPTGSVSFNESGVFNLSAVPEPASALLLALGLGLTAAASKVRLGKSAAS